MTGLTCSLCKNPLQLQADGSMKCPCWTSLPAIEDNPQGLHQRYKVEKLNGEPTDPNAFYFVLRLDGGGRDATHIDACRFAARCYAAWVRAARARGEGEHLADLAQDLTARVNYLTLNDPRTKKKP